MTAPEPAVHRELRGRGGRSAREVAVRFLCFFGPLSVALAQPVYQLAGTSGPAGIFLHILAFGILPAAALTALCFAQPRLAVTVETLVYWFTVLSVLRQAQLVYGVITEFSTGQRLAVAAALVVLAVVAAIVIAKYLRPFVAALGVVSIVFPALFVYERATWGATAPVVESQQPSSDGCVIILIFDELSLVPLLDPGGDIDRETFPNFYAFAHDSVWFRQAIANYAYTNLSVTSMSGAIYLREGPASMRGGIPFFTDDNLPADFDGNTYEDELYRQGFLRETIRPRNPLEEITGSLFAYIEMIVPNSIISPFLPRIVSGSRLHEIEGLRNFECGRNELRSRRLMMTHAPYIFAADGGFNRSLDNKFVVGADLSETYANYYGAVRYADRVLGDFVARLKRLGLYDRSTIVVTSDHGICWTEQCPGRESVNAIKRVDLSLARVPMMIRSPGLTPRIDDGDYQQIDFGPTLLDALGIEYRPPFPIDGRSALRGTAPVRRRLFYLSPAFPPVDLGDPMRPAMIAE